MEIYKILSSDDGNTKYTFIVSDVPVRNYRLLEGDTEIFYAEDDENTFKFKKKLKQDFEYYELEDLHLFLKLVDYFDSGMFESYDVVQKLTKV